MNKPVGEIIREERKKAGLTQSELAKRMGLSYQCISQIECGARNPKPSSLKRIADALGIDPDTITPMVVIGTNGPDVMKWLETEFSHDVAVKICKGEATVHEWGVIVEMYERIKGGDNA